VTSLGDMSPYELSRFQRRLNHDLTLLDHDRHRPSKRRRTQMARSRDEIEEQLAAIRGEWERRGSSVPA
jgi:hypothetical protein